MGTGTATFTLRLGQNEYKCDMRLPNGPVRVAELLPVMNAVAGLVVDNAVDEALAGHAGILAEAGVVDPVGIPGVQDKASALMIPVPIARSRGRYILKVDPLNIKAGISLGKALCDQGKYREGSAKVNAASGRMA